MKPAILLLAAAATIGAAPPRLPAPEPRFEAGGFEPFWSLVIENGQLTYDSGTGEPVIRIPTPRRQPIRNGYRYVVSPSLTIEIRHLRCNGYSWRTFTETVNTSQVPEEGCGGPTIAPARLNASSWRIGAIDGTEIPEHQGNLSFEWNGLVRGTIGCSEYSGVFRERRPVLRFGPMTVTRRDCETSVTPELERRALAIFADAPRMRFVDGDTLILTGPHGTARLIPD